MEDIISLWKDRNYTHGSSSPEWGKQLFNGLYFNYKDNSEEINITNFLNFGSIDSLDLGNIDFSNSIFKNISLRNCNLYNSNFKNSNLTNTSFFNCDCYNMNFENVKLNNLELTESNFLQNLMFPEKLIQILKGHEYGYLNFGSEKLHINKYGVDGILKQKDGTTLVSLIKYVKINNGVSNAEIKNWFSFENVEPELIDEFFEVMGIK